MNKLISIALAASLLVSTSAFGQGNVPDFGAVDSCGVGEVDYSSMRTMLPDLDQALFDRHDMNGNGTLDATEYESLKPELAAFPVSKTTTEATPAAVQPAGAVPNFESIDSTGCGKVDFSQVKSAVAGLTQKLFDDHDMDGDGALDITEYESLKPELAAL